MSQNGAVSPADSWEFGAASAGGSVCFAIRGIGRPVRSTRNGGVRSRGDRSGERLGSWTVAAHGSPLPLAPSDSLRASLGLRPRCSACVVGGRDRSAPSEVPPGLDFHRARNPGGAIRRALAPAANPEAGEQPVDDKRARAERCWTGGPASLRLRLRQRSGERSEPEHRRRLGSMRCGRAGLRKGQGSRRAPGEGEPSEARRTSKDERREVFRNKHCCEGGTTERSAQQALGLRAA
jgi:hypothetical protein